MNRRKRAKPYVWRFLTDWDRDGWNGVSYDGVLPPWQARRGVVLQRIDFSLTAAQHPIACSSRFHPRRAGRMIERSIRRFRAPLRRRYLKRLRDARS